MMKSFKFIFVIIIIFYFGCTKDTTSPKSDGYIVQGVVSNSIGPVVGAEISIDNAINWTTYSDTEGNFSISNVQEGEHVLTIKQSTPEGSYVEQSNSLQVYDDIILNSLRLPIPVILSEPVNITLSQIILIWNATDALDFREYKLYRHDSPGIDETTGELIYVSTSKNDTSFVDNNLISGKNYYYRIYIMNEFGKLGGSNVASAKTLIGNLIPDGAFEIPGSIFDNWQPSWGIPRTFEYDDSVKMQGVYALKGINNYPEYTDMELKTPVKLGAGITYEISAWLKASGMAQGTMEWIYVGLGTSGTSLTIGDANATTQPVEIEWTFISKIFTPSEDKIVTPEFTSGFENYWIDDLKLIVK